MARSAPVQTGALLLRSRPYGDADRIVTLFTEGSGKVSAIARHARASKKRFGGTLQPFVHFRASLVRGNGELYSLRETEAVRSFTGILADLDRVQAAASGLVFVRELSAVDAPERRLFADTLRWLTWVEHRADPQRSALLSFALRIMGLMGSAPGLEACHRCGKVPPVGRAAEFDARAGSLACRACGGAPHRLSAAARGWLLRSTTEEWIEACAVPPPDTELRLARTAMAAFITAHLNPELASELYADR